MQLPAHERDPPPVGRPGRRIFPGIVRRQLPLPAAVGVHDVDRSLVEAISGVGRPWPAKAIFCPSGDQRIPGPAWAKPSLPAPVGVHDLDNAAVAAAGRLADEGDLRARRCGGKARPCGERRGRRLGLRAASEEREERDSDERDEGHDCRVPASSPLRALPRLLDQRLDEGVELLASTGSLGRGGRGGAVTVTTTSVVRLS